jgi:hypothetical protein
MKTTLLSLARRTATVGQGLAILAWIAFIISLFLPVHWFTYPTVQKVASEPMMYGWKFALTFLMDTIFLPPLLILEFDFDLLKYLAFAMIYNIGNMLLILAPLLPDKLPNQTMRKVHLGAVFICALATVAYKYLENIQLGFSHYRGYDVWVLAYILLFAGSILMLNKGTGLQQ